MRLFCFQPQTLTLFCFPVASQTSRPGQMLSLMLLYHWAHYSFKVHVRSISVCLPHLDHGHLLSSSFPLLLSLTCETVHRLHPLPVRCFLIFSILNLCYTLSFTFSLRSFTIFTLTIALDDVNPSDDKWPLSTLSSSTTRNCAYYTPKKAWPCLLLCRAACGLLALPTLLSITV